jgi:hypothetical protein
MCEIIWPRLVGQPFAKYTKVRRPKILYIMKIRRLKSQVCESYELKVQFSLRYIIFCSGIL